MPLSFLDRFVQHEKELFEFLNSHHTPYWDAFMYLISNKWAWVGIIIAFLYFIFYKRTTKEAVFLLIGMALCILICDQLSSHLAKPFFARLRPTHFPGVSDSVSVVYGYRGGKYGFFSGHASNFFAYALYTSLIYKNRLYTIIIFTITAIIAYSRIYLGVHFVSDIVVGMIVGLAVGYLVYRIYLWMRYMWITPYEKNTGKVFSHGIKLWNYSLILFMVFLLTVSAQIAQITGTFIEQPKLEYIKK